jgi:hypothetical protein
LANDRFSQAEEENGGVKTKAFPHLLEIERVELALLVGDHELVAEASEVREKLAQLPAAELASPF